MTTKKNGKDVPVLLMLFNRPETTLKLFAKLREIKPKHIFITANGPRPGNRTDPERCDAVRSIFDGIDWECDVHKNFRDTNIGMQPHWKLALDWFFENTESGIILEDDCVPHPSFFAFSGDMLEKYKNDDRIMHINGSNFQFGRKRGNGSYYFSRYPHVWGWATWRRAWQTYDDKLSSFPDFKKRSTISKLVSNAQEKAYFMKFFERLYSGEYTSCDAKWFYSIWSHDGLAITPNVNMITNIGYGLEAGHTIIKDKTMGQAGIDTGEIIDPSPIIISPDKEADAFTFETCYHRNFWQKAFYVIAMRIAKFMR